jgi:hypothetical protein
MDVFGNLLGVYQMHGEQFVLPEDQDEIRGSQLQQAVAILSAGICGQRPEQHVRDYGHETLGTVIDFLTNTGDALGVKKQTIESLEKIFSSMTQPPVQEQDR